MDILGITGVAAITVICYLLGMALKAWSAFDDRGIPVMMGIFGCALGLLAYVFWPDVVSAHDPIMAAAIGIVSGLAATAVNQVWKQSKKEAGE